MLSGKLTSAPVVMVDTKLHPKPAISQNRELSLNLSTFDETHHSNLKPDGGAMTTIARILTRRVPAPQAEADILKQVALFCCAGLLVSLLMMTYGVDLSPGFF